MFKDTLVFQIYKEQNVEWFLQHKQINTDSLCKDFATFQDDWAQQTKCLNLLWARQQPYNNYLTGDDCYF